MVRRAGSFSMIICRFRMPRNFLLAATLGAWLGAWCFRLLRSGSHYSSIRLMVGCLLGGALGLIVAGLLVLGTPHATGIHPIVLVVIAAIIPGVGAWWCGIAMFRSTQPTKRGRLGWLPLSIAGTVAVWLIYPQFAAFPAARHRGGARSVGPAQYSSVHVLDAHYKKIPLIRESVGRVTADSPGFRSATRHGADHGWRRNEYGARGGGG